MTPLYFKDQADFRNWLSENHASVTELLVGYYKTSSGKPSMTWPQSVDEALCFGWIDGIRRSVDDERYTIRFTPRKPKSIWSAVNIEKAETLIKNGLMQPAGLASYQLRQESRSRIYSFESPKKQLSPALETQFKTNKKAWDYFHAQAPWYQKTIVHWIVTAKQETTRLARLAKLMEASSRQERLR